MQLALYVCIFFFFFFGGGGGVGGEFNDQHNRDVMKRDEVHIRFTVEYF